MLVYLDALIAALSVRDVAETTRLLAHPLARLLPVEVCAEARGLTDGSRDTLASPLRTMELRYRTAELLRDTPGVADQPEPLVDPRPPAPPPQLSRRGRKPQIELPLSA